MSQYLTELKVLEAAIAKRVAEKKRPPEETLAYAIRDIRFHRIRYILKYGRKCGTGMFGSRKNIRSCVYYFFKEEELMEVIQDCCEGKKMNSHNWKLVLFFLHNIAKVS